MPNPIPRWDPGLAATHLQRLRRWRLAGMALLFVAACACICDHLRAANRGDDWLRYDGRSFTFQQALDACTLVITDGPSDNHTTVAILGIKPVSAERSQEAISHLNALLNHSELILHLRTVEPRDRVGRLLADVFTNDGELVAANLAGMGLVVANHKDEGDFFVDIARAQSTARKRHLGVWINSDY